MICDYKFDYLHPFSHCNFRTVLRNMPTSGRAAYTCLSADYATPAIVCYEQALL